MKKVLSTIVAALVALSFAGIVSAAEVTTETKSETTPSGEMKTEKKEVKKKHHKKGKKAKKVIKKEETTTEPAPAAK